MTVFVFLPLDGIHIDEQQKNEYNSGSAGPIVMKLVSIPMFSRLDFLNMQLKFSYNQYFSWCLHFYPSALLAKFAMDAKKKFFLFLQV